MVNLIAQPTTPMAKGIAWVATTAIMAALGLLAWNSNQIVLKLDEIDRNQREIIKEQVEMRVTIDAHEKVLADHEMRIRRGGQ